MSLPDAVRYTGAFAGSYSGFSIPGLEVYEHDCDGAPCQPCQIDEGDVCRPRWTNRRDHGFLSRLNKARAEQPGVPYCRAGGCLDGSGMECTVPDLRTNVYPSSLSEGGFNPEMAYPQEVSIAGRRAQVRKLKESAKARVIAGRRRAAPARAAPARARVAPTQGRAASAHAVAGQPVAGNGYMEAEPDTVEERRSRRAWGNHANYNEEAIGIRYTPLAGDTGPLTEDVLIVPQ